MISTKIQPKIDRKKLVSMLGARKNAVISKALSTKIMQLNLKTRELVKPRIQYGFYRIESTDRGGVLLESDVYFKSARLSRTLEPCNEAVVFIATIGRPIDDEIHRLMKRNHYSEAYVLDAMGSLAVESVVNQFQEAMRETYKTRNMNVTLRFSPGYCDWAVTGQKQLFSLFEKHHTGVRLSDSCLMNPRKSVSGIFGVLPESAGPEKALFNPCRECKRVNCRSRRS